MSLQLGRNFREADRAVVRGNLPKANDGKTRPYGESGPTITVGVNRSGEAVAKDIQRRLMPDYDKVWAKGMQWVMEANAFDAAQETNVKMLAGILGAEVRKNGEFYRYTKQYTVSGRVGDKEASLDIHNIPLDKAKAILQVLAQET